MVYKLFSERLFFEHFSKSERKGYDYFYDCYAPFIFGLISGEALEAEVGAMLFKDTVIALWMELKIKERAAMSIFKVMTITQSNISDYNCSNNG